MKKEPVVCLLDEDVSIRKPPLHLIRSHGFDVRFVLGDEANQSHEPRRRNAGVPQAHTQWAGFTGHAQYSKAAKRCADCSLPRAVNVSATVLTVLSEGLPDLLVR